MLSLYDAKTRCRGRGAWASAVNGALNSNNPAKVTYNYFLKKNGLRGMSRILSGGNFTYTYIYTHTHPLTLNSFKTCFNIDIKTCFCNHYNIISTYQDRNIFIYSSYISSLQFHYHCTFSYHFTITYHLWITLFTFSLVHFIHFISISAVTKNARSLPRGITDNNMAHCQTTEGRTRRSVTAL